MTEIFPQKINEKRFEARLQKLIAGFLMVAEDFVKENEDQARTADATEIAKIPTNL